MELNRKKVQQDTLLKKKNVFKNERDGSNIYGLKACGYGKQKSNDFDLHYNVNRECTIAKDIKNSLIFCRNMLK